MTTTFLYFIKKTGGVNKACKHIAKIIGGRWTWKYIYHVFRGTAKPSDRLRSKLLALKLYEPRPSRQRHRKIIEAKTLKQLDQWNTLTADQLREALDDKAKGLK